MKFAEITAWKLMDSFFSNQLDFIMFFYGLAFILLGTTCVAITRIGGRAENWIVLALFGFLHGGSEWLDLTALVIGDTPAFAVARTALMTTSFVVLMEFARLEAIRLGLKAPGRWIYAPLLGVVALGGIYGGVSAAGSIARYIIGFTGALATGAIFVRFARGFSGTVRSLAICAAAGFALYAVAAGVIVPASSFWPSTVLNHDWFARTTGIPIQLARGVLACWISFSIWAIWGQHLISEVGSAKYAQFLHRQFIWTLVAMATILIGGWTLTEYLGGIYKQNVQREARGNIDLLASRIAGETATVEGMVQTLAASRTVRTLLVDGGEQDDARAYSLLVLNVEASAAKAGYIVNTSGAVVVSYERGQADTPDKPNFQSASFFHDSVAGMPGYHFAFDTGSGESEYFASYPVRKVDGSVVGVVVLKKALDDLEAALQVFDHAYFLIDPNGIVVMTNQPQMLRRPFWPRSAGMQSTLVRQSGALNERPMFEHEILDSTWTSFDSERVYLLRRNANYSQWSLVILTPIREIYASRVLGIVITLLVAVMLLIYLFGKERWFHDNVQMETRLKLQELARDLRFQATTDALTGVYNRLKFDEALASEVLRSARYKTPLSLAIYDVDRFKTINDTYGHQAGDHVLTELSILVADNIRSPDLLARWGGEEFVIMFSGCDGSTAYRAAEKLRAAIAQVAIEMVGNVTCSFGVAEYADGDTAVSLVARADRALYRAKINGRNRVELAGPGDESKVGLVSVA